MANNMHSIKSGNLSFAKKARFFLSTVLEAVEKPTSMKHSVMLFEQRASSSYVLHPLALHVSSSLEGKQHTLHSRSPLTLLTLTLSAAFPKKAFVQTFYDLQKLLSLMNV